MGERESDTETEADGVETFNVDFGKCVTLRSVRTYMCILYI